MKEIKENCYKGTRILLGNEKRNLLSFMVENLVGRGFEEISIPIIQHERIFAEKVGEENNNLMFTFEDNGKRALCLAPEYTAVVQNLAHSVFKNKKDLKLFYVQECFRGEKPQAGRYRQFTQLGVEIINPTREGTYLYLRMLATNLLKSIPGVFELNVDVVRGLEYYEGGKGFEITCEALGAQKQVCGGGEYQGGAGFAIGIDRLLLLLEKYKT